MLRDIQTKEYKSGGRTVSVGGPSSTADAYEWALDEYRRVYGRVPDVRQRGAAAPTSAGGKSVDYSQEQPMVSVHEVAVPWGVGGMQAMQYAGEILQEIAKDLGLKQPWPAVRWFDEIRDGRCEEPEWVAHTAHGGKGSGRGFYDPSRNQMWLKSDTRDYYGLLRLVAHELRHAWQWSTQGPDYFKGYGGQSVREHQAERDAEAYADRIVEKKLQMRGW